MGQAMTSVTAAPWARLALIALALGLAPQLARSQPKPPAPATVNRLADDLWEVPGVNDAANVTVLVTDEGLVVVDGRYENQYDELIRTIREKISTRPIKYLINTHYHADHSGANARYIQAGATVISSIVSRDNIVGKVQSNAPPNVAPPTLVFAGQMRLFVGGKEVRLTSYGPAHTGSDVTVLFVKDRVICIGDLGYAPDPGEVGGPHPLIDYAGGGAARGWIARLDTITGGADFDVVVPGHEALATKADLITYRNVLERLRDDVAAYLKDGTRTEADLRAHLVRDKQWPDTGIAIARGGHGLYMEFKP
jgi:cyclase